MFAVIKSKPVITFIVSITVPYTLQYLRTPNNPTMKALLFYSLDERTGIT
jgi:hypothetical protein